ncbi:MAG: hypothetical protein ABMA64_35845, partial [Myxococcota bacterium]
MADKTADDDLDLKPADAGAAFRVEMFLTNALLGYWKHLVAIVVVGLLGVLLWGQYRDWYVSSQRAVTTEISNSLRKLPAPVEALPEAFAAGQADAAAVEGVGDELQAIANGAKGPARIESLLLAAELFRMTNKPDKQRVALEAATNDADGALRYAAEAGIANLDLAEGKGDLAVERLRRLAGEESGFLAEQSTLDLALALEELGRKDEANQVYVDFIATHQDSPRAERAKERQLRLQASAAAPAPAPT